MEEEVISGSGWHAEVTMADGTVHDVPVLAWGRIPAGMGPMIVLPGDACATLVMQEHQRDCGFLRDRGIRSVSVSHPAAFRVPSPGSRPLPDTGPR